MSDERISSFELFKHDIVVVSYNTLSAEFGWITKFEKDMASFKSGMITSLPSRPTTSLLCSLYVQNRAKQLGPYIVLDEAHKIKNTWSRAYAAVQAIRPFYQACIMMTGTPLDNTWKDAYALLSLLDGQDAAGVCWGAAEPTRHQLANSGKAWFSF